MAVALEPYDPPELPPRFAPRLIMPFGKWKGTLLEQLPEEYVSWMLIHSYDEEGTSTIPYGLRKALERILGSTQANIFKQIVAIWWAELEEDFADDEETLAVLQYAHQRLRALAGINEPKQKTRRSKR